MTPQAVALYVGLPYADNGSGPDSYNCWGLLRHIQEQHFGRYLPEVPIGDSVGTREVHEASERAGTYGVVQYPCHGDATLLRGGDCPHVGVYLEIDGGGVLHSMSGYGVIWTPRRNLRILGFSRITFYRVYNARPLHSHEGSVSAHD